MAQLHHVLSETGKETQEAHWLHLSFGLANLLADESYGLYRYFAAADLKKMLRLFRASALQMLEE